MLVTKLHSGTEIRLIAFPGIRYDGQALLYAMGAAEPSARPDSRDRIGRSLSGVLAWQTRPASSRYSRSPLFDEEEPDGDHFDKALLFDYDPQRARACISPPDDGPVALEQDRQFTPPAAPAVSDDGPAK
jgi:hypothetical protein